MRRSSMPRDSCFHCFISRLTARTNYERLRNIGYTLCRRYTSCSRSACSTLDRNPTTDIIYIYVRMDGMMSLFVVVCTCIGLRIVGVIQYILCGNVYRVPSTETHVYTTCTQNTSRRLLLRHKPRYTHLMGSRATT